MTHETRDPGRRTELPAGSEELGVVRWARAELERIQASGLWRTLRVLDPDASRLSDRTGCRFINLSTNDYLGLGRHPQVAQAAARAAQEQGTGAGASRLVTGTRSVHEELECRLSDLVHQDSALVFPSGYQTNVGVMAGLGGPDTTIFSDQENHASIIDGCRLARAEVVVYRHLDPEDLRRKLKAHPARPGGRLVVTDAVFSTTGALAPVQDLAAVAAEHDAGLVVDEAHALGVLGPEGSGWCRACGVSPLVTVGTLSKSFGAGGGFAASIDPIRHYLVNRSRSFIFTTGLSPALAAAALEAVQIAASPLGDRLREKLWRNVDRLAEGLAEQGWPVWRQAHIVSVICGGPDTAVALSRELLSAGILALPLRPPTVPEGQSLIRMTVPADMDEPEVEETLRAYRHIRDHEGHIFSAVLTEARLPAPPPFRLHGPTPRTGDRPAQESLARTRQVQATPTPRSST